MRVPINMGVKGKVTATLTNIKTGEKQEVKGDNLILNHYLDWAMERGLGILGTTTFDRCYIGTSATPPQPTDTTFVGTQLAVSSTSKLIKNISIGKSHRLINSYPEIGVGNVNQLALTPDNEILLVGNGSSTPTLKAFKIDKSDWSLTELNVPAFDVFDPGLGAASGLSCGGDYLFVGLNYSPWGKLFKRNGDNFIFVSDVPGLSRNIRFSEISPNGKYLVVCGDIVGDSTEENVWVYEILENGSLTQIDHDIVGECYEAKFSPDSTRLAVANYNYFRLYKVVDSSLEQYFSEYRDSTSMPTIIYYVRSVAWLDNINILCLGQASPNVYTNRLKAFKDIHGEVVKAVDSYSLSELSGKFSTFANGVVVCSGGRNMIYVKPSSVSVTDRHSIKILDSINNNIPESLTSSIAIDSEHKVVFVRILNETSNTYNLGIYKLREEPINIQNYSRQWTFPAGVGTGVVRRIGLQANSSSAPGGNNRHVAQIVLPEPLEKTNLHQLDVIWEIEVENPGVWEGVIPGGSRDGSDLAWRVTINEEQFLALVSTGYSIPANWFGVTGTPNVRIGTSNEDSDLVFDRENLQGEQIQYISSTAISVVNPYVPGSLKRTIRLFLEVNQGNGQIGEIVFGGSSSDNSLARITFDPPLDKPPDVGPGANPYRIYFDLEIGWQRG